MKPIKGTRCDVKKIKKCFKDINIFDAVIGKDLNITNPNIVHPMTYSVIKYNLGGDWTQIDSLGALGASMSHISLWKKCIELNEPIIVIEDDVKINCSKCKIMSKYLEKKPKDCDFLSLMNIRNKSVKSQYDTEYFKYINDPYFMGAQVYYITPRAAKIIIKYSLPITMHIDMYVSSCSAQGLIKGYAIKENLYDISDQLYDLGGSLINHKFFIKKTLPNNNTFYYLIVIFIFIIVTTNIALIVNKLKNK
jgi:GR25 family glycosyltransferase involved in LPS biosynthesis